MLCGKALQGSMSAGESQGFVGCNIGALTSRVGSHSLTGFYECCRRLIMFGRVTLIIIRIGLGGMLFLVVRGTRRKNITVVCSA